MADKEAKIIKMKPKEEIAEEALEREDNSSEPKQTEQPDVNMFDFGKLMVNCGQCKAEYSLDDGIKGGIQLPALYTVEGHRFTLACKECGNTMSLYFVEGEEKITEENKEESADELQEDSKA